MAEYLYIKHVLLRPSIAQALQNEGSVSKIVEELSLSEIEADQVQQKAFLEAEVAKGRDMVENQLFLPQIEALKQMNLKVALK